MSSKRRVRRKACEGKVRYETFAQARSAAFLRSRDTGEWIVPYRCRFGKHYHIGHQTVRARQALSALGVDYRP